MTRRLLAMTLVWLVPLIASAARIGPGDFGPTATVVDFEGLPTNALPTVPGMSFLSTAIAAQWFGAGTNHLTSMFGGAFAGNQLYQGNQDYWSDIGVSFASPVPAAGAWVSQVQNFLGLNASELLVVALDGSGSILDQVSVTLPPDASPPIFVGFAFSSGIARLEWRGASPGFFGVDNITFGEYAPVPEPALPAVLLVGLLALGSRRILRR